MDDEGMDEAFAAYQAQEEYEESQAALPPHKRNNYAERMHEMADMERKRRMEDAWK